MPTIARPGAGHRGPVMVMRRGRLVRAPRTVSREIASEGADIANTHIDADIASQERITGADKACIALFVLTLCLPFEAAFGPIRLMPLTAFLLLAAIPAAAVWLSKRAHPFNVSDWLILGFWLWATLAIVVNHGVLGAIEPQGMMFVQTVGAYLVGRAFVYNAATMRYLIKACLAILVVTLPLVIFESVTRINPILTIAQLVGPSYPAQDMSLRMGLTRAQAYFNHPILFGVFCASLMSLFAYGLSKQSKIVRLGGAAVAAICAMTSLSTGALLSLNMQFGLMLWRRIFRDNPARWKILGIIAVIAYFVVDLFTERTPFHTFVQYATFSSGSSYTRILIWQYGSAEVLRHPLFGIGFGDWVRPGYMGSSVDNFWLLQGMRYGFPGVALLAGAVIVTMLRIGGRSGPTEEVSLMRRGITFALLATVVSIFSVHLWNSTYMWLTFLLGASVWLTHPAPDPVAAGADRGIGRRGRKPRRAID